MLLHFTIDTFAVESRMTLEMEDAWWVPDRASELSHKITKHIANTFQVFLEEECCSITGRPPLPALCTADLVIKLSE